MKKAPKAALAALSVVALALPALAQPSSALEFYQAFKREVGRGYTDAQPALTGSLSGGQSRRATLNLAPGHYRILGACDIDCADMDLSVFNPAGALIAEDVELDSFPVVNFQVPRAGRYTLDIDMIDCEVAPCSYVVGVMRRN